MKTNRLSLLFLTTVLISSCSKASYRAPVVSTDEDSDAADKQGKEEKAHEQPCKIRPPLPPP